jgi:hypothetical protein
MPLAWDIPVHVYAGILVDNREIQSVSYAVRALDADEKTVSKKMVNVDKCVCLRRESQATRLL